MEAYTDFAGVYDTFMDETPYEEWSRRLILLLHEYGIRDGLVLDLGCGTGTLTELMAQAGYDMIGVDLSDEMLNIALQKKEKSGIDILYLNQDMREFELYGTVRAMISVCDSVNYLTSLEELTEMFRLANNYLDPQGVFIFDFNTVHKYRDIIADNVIAENREKCSFIWENFYYEEEQMNEYDLTIFVNDEETGLYRKFEETHYQRGYTLEEVKACLKKAGLTYRTSYDAYTEQPPTEESERILVICSENGK